MAQIILDSNNNLIQGDFDNATLNNRTKLQTTTTNATTNVYAVPNGSATSAGYSVANNADPTNCSKIVMATNGSTDTQIISGINGSGSYLPMSFYVNNTLALQISTAGVVTAPYGGFSGAGGMTLLGTVSATSGNSVSLGSLTLTNYKSIQIVAQSIISNGGGVITITSDNSQASNYNSPFQMTTSQASSGINTINLTNGVFSGTSGQDSTPNPNYAGGKTNITTATTTVYFRLPGSNVYSAGSFLVYGVS